MMKLAKAPVVILLALSIHLLPINAVHGQSSDTTDANQIHPLPIEQDFSISGALEHPMWKKAQPVKIRNQVMPDDDARAPVHTEVRILYSSEHLYVGFKAHDPNPKSIRAHVADRDESFSDDFVGVFLDPFNNNQRAYEFFVNPLGVQMDGMRSNNREDMNFDALWYSDGVLTETGYQAVIKIPFKSMNFPTHNVRNWSIQFIRNYPRENRYQLVWTDVSIDKSCLICQSGELMDMEGIESSKTVEILPYAMGFQSAEINNLDNPDSGLDNEQVDGRFGGSISYAPTSTTSLNAVVNPDFSQVESDAAQISANETFALYYPEKRPFFMKGASLFETPENLFYSRMINQPSGAAKVTRNADRYSLAFLSSYDRSTPFIVPGKLGSSLVTSELEAYSNILRGKYNFGAESHIGGLVTTRNQQDGFNYVGSVDWKLLLADNYYFNGQVGFSETKELQDTTLFKEQRTFGESRYDATFNGEQYSGMLVSTEFEREAKYYTFSVEYSSYSPTFQAQNGFVNRTDRREFELSQGLNYYPNSSWLTRGGLRLEANWRYDYSGQFQERFIFANLYNRFSGQTSLYMNYLPLNDERFRGEYFTGLNRFTAGVNSDAFDAVSFGGRLETGRFIRRSDDPEIGHGYNLSARATIEPTARLQLSLNYSYSTLSSLDDSQTYYSGDIIRLNSKYNFSRQFFARLITQYNSFDERLQIYPLLYYKLNPFTKFYIGMTDYLKKYDQPGGLNGFRQTSRQFFVKFQYLFRSQVGHPQKVYSQSASLMDLGERIGMLY